VPRTEKDRERSRRYYEANKEKVKAYVKAWKKANRERAKDTDRALYLANRETRLAYAAEPSRRARKAERMRKARAADPIGHRLKFRAWNYTLTVDEVKVLLEGGCDVCGSKDKLHIDHDHKCCPTGASPRSCGKCVRGVLCHSCNTALGLLCEDLGRVEALWRHLQGRQTTGERKAA
jgi:hypothetical protein